MAVYLLFIIPPLLLGLWAQHWVKSSFAKWSQVSAGAVSGADVASRILAANGLQSIPVSVTPGELSDHYDPRDKSVHLSQAVAQSNSVASIAVAAHEVGHAIQHAKGSAFFQVRTALAGPVQIASQLWYLPLVAGIFLRQLGLIEIAILLYALVVLFHLVTLPVEFDASRRAMGQLEKLGITSDGTVHTGARNVLSAAAMTYVAGALASLSQLAYFVFAFLGQRN
jgi:Zn-dependent membrane protease YugP